MTWSPRYFSINKLTTAHMLTSSAAQWVVSSVITFVLFLFQSRTGGSPLLLTLHTTITPCEGRGNEFFFIPVPFSRSQHISFFSPISTWLGPTTRIFLKINRHQSKFREIKFKVLSECGNWEERHQSLQHNHLLHLSCISPYNWHPANWSCARRESRGTSAILHNSIDI